MFQAVYESSWHNPVFFWAAGALFLALLLHRLSGGGTGDNRAAPPPRAAPPDAPLTTAPRDLRLIYSLIVAALVSALDAGLTGGLTPLARSPLLTPVAVLFVIVGDWRYFLLLLAVLRPARGAPRVALQSLGLALIVPVASYIPQGLWPGAFTEPHRVFLLYEVLFLIAALFIRLRWLPSRHQQDSARLAWLCRVTTFEAIQYALWALADALILAGLDAGYLLRLIPNAMYYAVFLPLVYLLAPRELR